MNRPRNFRVFFLLGILLIVGVAELVREHRPSFLRLRACGCAHMFPPTMEL